MCGRYVQTKYARKRARHMVTVDFPELRPESWNVAPTMLSLAVRASEDGAVVADWLSWGFLGDAGPGAARPINARVESAATKLPFREAWATMRCMVPVDGWYEWRLEEGRKQPYYFYRLDGQPSCLAGLWMANSFCLLTMAADGDLAGIHERRPLAIREADALAWVRDRPSTPENVVFRAVPPTEIAFHPVSPRVSNSRNDGADLIEAFSPISQPELLL